MSRRKTRPTNAAGDWDFFSFPCLFAFALGAFVAALLVPLSPFLVFVLSLFGVSFGLAHIMTHTFRRKTLERARQREEEDERERRALAARAIAAQQNEARSNASKRRRRNRRGGVDPNQIPPGV